MWRDAFKEKVGMDITLQEYEKRLDGSHFGHVGLEESGRLIAVGFGWQIDTWEHDMLPVQPDPDGLVLGTRETLRGMTADGRCISLHFEARSGIDVSYDEIIVDGAPPLHLRFEPGVPGDETTVASVLRCARVIPRAPRGLQTVLDLPLC